MRKVKLDSLELCECSWTGQKSARFTLTDETWAELVRFLQEHGVKRCRREKRDPGKVAIRLELADGSLF